MKPRIMDAVGFIGQFVSDHWEAVFAQEDLKSALMDQGFSSEEITRAFGWIEEHTMGPSLASKGASVSSVQIRPSMRMLTQFEQTKISPEGYGVLVSLYERGVLDILQFEDTLERAMRMSGEEVDALWMKRLASLVLFNRVQSEWREWLQSKSTLIQ